MRPQELGFPTASSLRGLALPFMTRHQWRKSQAARPLQSYPTPSLEPGSALPQESASSLTFHPCLN